MTATSELGYRVLDDDGGVVDESAVREIHDGVLLDIYRDMKLARRYDERAVSLQRQGRMGTYPPLYGHEASQVASVHATADEDWLFPSYRENGAIIAAGVPMAATLKNWMGHPCGNEPLANENVFAIANPIATQVPHATGAAWASKLQGEQRAFLCYFGDGATSEGDFHEGLNFAGVFDTPTVFFCTNNQWAISVPRERQTAAESIAQKAEAYGFEGHRVDGMDPLAVYRVTRDAVEKAKHPGDGEKRPTLVEASVYRLGAHSTSDDPSVYRDEEESERWRERDPIGRMESFLTETGRLDAEGVDAIESEVTDRIEAAIDEAEAYESDPGEIFSEVYESKTPRLESQEAHLTHLRERHELERE